jgi:lambda family phage minor tail protein L
MAELGDIVQQSTLPAFIELFEIDLSPISGQSSVYRFTPMFNTANPGDGHLTWGGNTYLPFPIGISNIGFSMDDAPSRPALNIANVNKMFGMLSFTVQDIIGAKVTYIRTFEQYLGAGTLSAPPLKYFIARKTAHNLMGITFELRSPTDKERAVLPKRQMLKTDFPGLGTNKVAQ